MLYSQGVDHVTRSVVMHAPGRITRCAQISAEPHAHTRTRKHTHTHTHIHTYTHTYIIYTHIPGFYLVREGGRLLTQNFYPR